ncbi:MAG: hypothetical protein J6P42_00095, partial [Oscillospiraceae bacterium]|nr:hypothetical protein [Oscillospiraceae bacterium]
RIPACQRRQAAVCPGIGTALKLKNAAQKNAAGCLFWRKLVLFFPDFVIDFTDEICYDTQSCSVEEET